jgi:hypothetical protein
MVAWLCSAGWPTALNIPVEPCQPDVKEQTIEVADSFLLWAAKRQ